MRSWRSAMGAGGLLAGLSCWAGAAALPGCGGDGGGGGAGEAARRLQIAPSPIDFGRVGRAGSADLDVRVRVRADADGPVTVREIAIEDDAARVFAMERTPLPRTLNPGASFALRVTYTPAGAQDASATFEVRGDEGVATAALLGVGLPPGIFASPAPLDFGAMFQGGPDVARELEISNGAASRRSIFGIQVSNPAGGSYALAEEPLLPRVLAPGETMTVTVRLKPFRFGAVEGELLIASDDPHRPELRVRLLANVFAPPPPADEFQVNRSTFREQSRPQAAALERPAGSNGAVAVVLYFDRSNTTTAGVPKNQFAAAPISAGGQMPGDKDDKVVRTAPGLDYTTIEPDLERNNYAVPARYEVSNDSSAKALWSATVGASGMEFGGVLVTDTDHIPSAQSLYSLDVAVERATGNRFFTWRLSGTSTDPLALPPGLYGRVLSRDGVTLTAIFRLPSEPNLDQRAPHIEYDGAGFLVTFVDAGVLKGRRFDAAGRRVAGDFPISDAAAGPVAEPQMEANAASGDCAVVWKTAGEEIAGRLVRRDGSLGPLVILNQTRSGTQEQPAAAFNPAAGQWMVVWTGPDSSGKGIYARKFDASLNPLGSERLVNQIVAGDQTAPAATWVPLVERWLVAWTGMDEDGAGVKGRYLP